MKKVLLVAALLMSQMAFSQIIGSDLEPRHQNKILEAVANKCYLNGKATQISSVAKNIQYDQGYDTEHTTELNVQDTIDQYYTVDYRVIVVSMMYDGYDHNAKDHGYYEVKEITCEQK
jgi:protein-disulfide isomerase-like protein with CxxC motif